MEDFHGRAVSFREGIFRPNMNPHIKKALVGTLPLNSRFRSGKGTCHDQATNGQTKGQPFQEKPVEPNYFRGYMSRVGVD